MTPIAAGLRSPCGLIVTSQGEWFTTENQGEWVGSGRLTHITPGDFAGHPAGLAWSRQPGSTVRLRPDDINLVGAGVDPIEVRMRIGMVFQKPNPFPKTVFENVAYGLRLRGVRNRTDLAERVEGALRAAAIWDEVKDRLSDSALALSGGQMQRLCIARALATQPEILLFDEPTSALDPIATAKIAELLSELRQHVTILLVTHNLQQAARVTDFTAFMYPGELVEVGATSMIFTNPGKKATEDYITGRYG
jgi:phosphate transport system ATP-binding protein